MKLFSRAIFIISVGLAVVGAANKTFAAPVAEAETVRFETNAIADVVIPDSPYKNSKDRLKIYMPPFRSDRLRLPLNTEEISLDRLETIASSAGRCHLYEEKASAHDYVIEGIFRRFQVTQYNSSSGMDFSSFFKDIVGKNVKLNGKQVDFGKVDWASSNSVVKLDCELTLKLKRSKDGELLKTVTGQFSRTTFLKSLAADLAGVTFRRGTEKIVMKNDGSGPINFMDANFVQGRVIEIALANAFVQMVPQIDEEIEANRAEKAAK